MRIFTFWLFLGVGGWGVGGGGSRWRKNKKISLFHRLWGENDPNSINIRASARKLLAFDREQNFGLIQAKTWKIFEQSSIFWQPTVVIIPAFFHCFCLKRIKFLTFNI